MALDTGTLDTGNWAPVREERDDYTLPVKGELPRELSGTLFRNGPNPQFETPNAHWFVGDGMLHAFTLDNGRASYRNRWVRTPKFLAEHDAGRAIWSGKGFGGQKLPDAPPTVVTDAGVANTNVIWHAGKLLALEEAHLPTEIDPKTLDTKGYVDYARGIAGPVTAHPKIDPVTGELIFFGYNATGPFSTGMTYGAIAASGVVNRFERFEAPYSSMVHDFIVTGELRAVPDPAADGQHGPRHERTPGLHVGARQGRLRRRHEARRLGQGHPLVPRRRLLRLPHHERVGGRGPHRRRRDAARGAGAVPRRRRQADRSREADRPAGTLDLQHGRRQRHLHARLSRRPAGRVPAHRRPPRRARQPAQLVCGCHRARAWAAPSTASPMSTTRPAGASCTSCRTGDATSEPVFVPRAADAPEGDGWLLATVWRAAENRSDLAVFNATEVDRGPVATVELASRVPFGLHGNWVPAAA